jgi:uncharacterized radical SAM superfamily Fe-S cluster-containing enzyme
MWLHTPRCKGAQHYDQSRWPLEIKYVCKASVYNQTTCCCCCCDCCCRHARPNLTDANRLAQLISDSALCCRVMRNAAEPKSALATGWHRYLSAQHRHCSNATVSALTAVAHRCAGGHSTITIRLSCRYLEYRCGDL